ncbi:MAG: UDP-N-acetylmuramate dehydrogenase [Alphaproteobacteria bacterium]
MRISAEPPMLLDRLPPVRGRYTANADLKRLAWFRVGGPAEVLYEPADIADLQRFLAACPADVPLTVIGLASNLLIRDGGIRGVTIRLGRGLSGISVDGTTITAEAGAADAQVARIARDHGLAGLEFLSGIPGAIGGAVRMNAGAYGREMRDVVTAALALDPDGHLHRLEPAELGFAYRHSATPQDWIFVAAELEGTPDAPEAIARRMVEIASARAETQPVKSRTGGSTFANPPGAKAWELIDAAGCRGLRRGGAMVSEQHCNFLINTGDATADDLETLGEDVCERVRAASGIALRWEIRRIGEACPEARP